MKPQHLPPSPPRDLRIDMIRGLALLIIFIDHSPFGLFQNFRWLSSFTFHRFSFIDAADVFFFLSGYVGGIVYTRRFLAKGLVSCFRAAGRRCLQLYLAEVSLFVVCLAIVDLGSLGRSGLPAELLHTFRDAPVMSAFAVLTLRNPPHLLGLLPVYMVFVALTPVAVFLAIHRRKLLLWIIMGSYLGVQATVRLHLTTPDTWPFNPFAWQLIFFGALLLGFQTVRQPEWFEQRRPWLVRAAIGGLALIVLVRIAPTWPVAALLHSHVLSDLVPRVIPYADKQNLEPLRLINLALWVIVVAAANPGSRFLRYRLAIWAIICGQNSLAVYWVGVVLNYLGVVFVISRGSGKVWDVLWTLGGCLALVGTGFAWKWLKTVGKEMPGRWSAGTAPTVLRPELDCAIKR